MNQYEIKDAIFKIYGYFYMPQPEASKGDARPAFERAKRDCVAAFKKKMEQIESVTFDEYCRHKGERGYIECVDGKGIA